MSLYYAFFVYEFWLRKQKQYIQIAPAGTKKQLLVPAYIFWGEGSCLSLQPNLSQRSLQKVLRCKQRTQSRCLKKIFWSGFKMLRVNWGTVNDKLLKRFFVCSFFIFPYRIDRWSGTVRRPVFIKMFIFLLTFSLDF